MRTINRNDNQSFSYLYILSCALTLLVGRQEGHLAYKTLSSEMLACRFAYGPADATATHSLAPVNPDWFYQNDSAFLVPAYLGCPGKKAVKRI